MYSALWYNLHAVVVIVTSKGVTARRGVVLAAAADASALFLLPEGALLVPADPLQLLLHAHAGPVALHSTQLLLHCTVWTLLTKRERGEHLY